MKRRRMISEARHPFDKHPFEALCCGTWRSVEFIDIRDGSMTVHCSDDHHVIQSRSPYSNVRVKSRQATLSDCICYLRPGVDVCVLKFPQHEENAEEASEPVFADARITSIERKPHESQCSCQFFVNFYVNQGPLGSEKTTISKDSEVVGVNQIFILQKLEALPCEGQFYRWDFSNNCSSMQRTKLFLGKFSSELTWLLVASVLKQGAFHVRSVQNKIVYQILDTDDEFDLCKSNNNLHSINFEVDDGILTPTVVQFDVADTKEAEIVPYCDKHEDEASPIYDETNLRRSKRRYVRPERFLGCETSELEVGWVRCMPYTPEKWKEDDLYLPLSYLIAAPEKGSEKQTKSKTGAHSSTLAIEDVPICKLKRKRKKDKSDMEVKSSMGNEREQKSSIKVKSSANKEREDNSSIKVKSKASKEKEHKSSIKVKSSAGKEREHGKELAIVPVMTEGEPVAIENFDSPTKTSKSFSRKDDAIPLSSYTTKASHVSQRKREFELDDFVFEKRGRGRPSIKKHKSIRFRPVRSRKHDFGETATYQKRTLSAGAYNKLINSYMKSIDNIMMSQKEEPQIIDQWEQFKASRNRPATEDKAEASPVEEDDESELEMLWREMELCLASSYLEENEARISSDCMPNSSESCQHQFKVDDEIGILCKKCGFVKTEIKYVSAPFMEQKSWIAEDRPYNEESVELKLDEDSLKILRGNVSSEGTTFSEENENVWALIPELKKKLHLHQKKAFEFLWKNVAGSMVPNLMDKASKRIGGCVISHTPGAGKTFLIIAFLVSYLKLFPGKRPLVLAPKTTLYTWYKEFIKWEIPVPVHLIHGRRSYTVFRQQTVSVKGGPKPSQDVMHVLDCLEKIQKWHAGPSVLVMGYTSFLTLMREDAKFAHRKYMAKVLRESPGLLILDEGHNPRSTKSRLRKVLMKVQTDLRILLSGTLFQNNFCEYFNTLCLARPKFIREVLRKLDPKFKRKKNGVEKARHLLESRARKFFLDIISKKIDSDDSDERLEGLNMLKRMTNGFIDVFEGAASDGLPGLQIYTILMNSTDIQHEMLVKLHKIMAAVHGYPLEIELLITLASIHPWLVTTSNCVHKFFNSNELADLEKLRYDFKKGSKIMFVLNLVYRVVKNEKVLIFCHNIAPINVFVELFENVFRWQKGREIQVLTGDLELFERGRIMDRFEETNGPSKVLLASITACAEGISLTAASRVIMLDSEWNPSKTKQAIARAFRPGQQKMVYVYQLLATGTLEEDKYSRTTWKEWVSSMIFSEAFVADPSRWQAQKIEDEVLREMVEEDRVKSFHMIMKNEKLSIDRKLAPKV